MQILLYKLGYYSYYVYTVTQIFFSKVRAEEEAQRLNEKWQKGCESRHYIIEPIWSEELPECVTELGIHISKHLEQQWEQFSNTKQPMIAKFNERVILMLPPPSEG